MKIAFVHDYLNQYGGAERVLEVLCELFPHAPIYTTLYDAQATRQAFSGRTVRTSFMQRLPFVTKYHHAFPFLMPLAMEQFDLSSFDVVLSVSHSFAKGIITNPGTRHICYCLTPPRYLWDDSHKYVSEFKHPLFIKKLLPPFLSYLRIWDREASLRPNELVGISQFVQQRIKKYYAREASLLYPPVSVENFSVASGPGSYFLMVGRLVTYKKFDLAIEAFNTLGWPLKIVGTGVDLKRLKKMAKPNIEFLGQVGDKELSRIYQDAKALIFPQEEDFGIVPLEAMASGRPVIAYRGGGAVETVADGVTGVFFDEQTLEPLLSALEKFSTMHFDAQACRSQAEKFDVEVFKSNIRTLLA